MESFLLLLYIIGDFFSGGERMMASAIASLYLCLAYFIGTKLVKVNAFKLFPLFVPRLIAIVSLFVFSVVLSLIQTIESVAASVLLGLMTLHFLFFLFIAFLSVLIEKG